MITKIARHSCGTAVCTNSVEWTIYVFEQHMIHCLVNRWFIDTNNLRCVFMSSCCVCCSSAPGSAAHLKLEALNEKTLRLSWSPPDGDWDFYRILLFNGSSLLMNRTIERNLVEFSFTNWTLIPGRLYRAAVSVESGYLSSTADCHGRLGVLLINSLLS